MILEEATEAFWIYRWFIQGSYLCTWTIKLMLSSRAGARYMYSIRTFL